MKIIAHRGYSSHYPENTPVAWTEAYKSGADVIEADVRFSKDGVAVLAHDPDLKRVFGREERPEDLDHADLAALRNSQGGMIADLVDVLAFAEQGRQVLLDLKDESATALSRLAGLVASEVRAERHRNVIMGAHEAATVAFFKARGGVTILGFIPDPAEMESFVDAGADIIRLWERDVTVEAVNAVAALAVPVWVTTGGAGSRFTTGDTDSKMLHGLRDLGVAGVLVNDVAYTAEALVSVGA